MSAAAAAAKSLQSCPTLCDPIEGSPPHSPVPGILQARTLEWVAISFSNVGKVKSESDMDCSLPGSFFHGIFQARVLEWVAIAFSGKRVKLNSISDLLFCYICWKKWTCKFRKCNTDSSFSNLEITLILTIYNVLK